MANKIEGITIRIGGDTTGLQDALKGVNAQISKSQSALREVEKSLKLDPSNIELLEQKQKALNDTVEAYNKKLKTLKEAQKQMADAGLTDKNRAKYEALTREIVNTEGALKKATKAAEAFDVQLAKAGATLGKVGNAANTVSEKTKALSTAAAGVIAGVAGMGLSAVKSADELNTLAKQSGVTTEELQKWQYASEIVDVSFDTMTSSLAKMTKQLSSDSGEEKFRQLGVSVRDSSGAFRDSSAIFYDTVAALGRVTNETERDVLAMEIFGRSANELAGIIDDGGASLKALGDEAERLGIVLDQDTIDSLNEVNDQLDKLKAQAKGELAKAGAAAIEALTPVLEKLISTISSLLTWIGSLDPVTLQILLTIAAVVAAISPLAGLIGKVSFAIKGVIEILPLLGGALTILETVTIVGLIAAIGYLVVTIVQNWDEIKALLLKAVDKVKEVFGKIVDTINTAVDKVKAFFAAARDSIVGIWVAITDAVKEKVNAIIGFVNNAIESINALISAVNSSALGKALGLNIGELSTIPELALSGNRGGNTTNNYTTNYNTSSQPMQVNVQLDRQTMARAMVEPMNRQMSLAGSSSIR